MNDLNLHKKPLVKSKFATGQKVKIVYEKKGDTILTKEFNPMGAPESNTFYYALKSDPTHFYREDYLAKITNPQQTLF